MTAETFFWRSDAGQNRIQSFAFIIAVIACVLFSVAFVLNSTSGRPNKIELDSQINPNNAPLGSLVRLPGIGIVRAAAIVSYRKSLTQQDCTASAFRNCDDLQKVKGIGPKTVQNICQWLKFE
jgi:competence ComEA-like helix-hairpin-helix protein